MNRCWKTVNNCTSTTCGPNGVCHSEIGQMICTCNWGYSGDRCEKSLRDEFFKDFGYSSVTGATITVGEMLLKLAKICVLGYSLSSAQGSVRSFCFREKKSIPVVLGPTRHSSKAKDLLYRCRRIHNDNVE